MDLSATWRRRGSHSSISNFFRCGDDVGAILRFLISFSRTWSFFPNATISSADSKSSIPETKPPTIRAAMPRRRRAPLLLAAAAASAALVAASPSGENGRSVASALHHGVARSSRAVYTVHPPLSVAIATAPVFRMVLLLNFIAVGCHRMVLWWRITSIH